MNSELLRDDNLPPLDKRPFAFALLASLLWLVALAAYGTATFIPALAISPALRSIGIVAGMTLALSAPLALIWLTAAQLRARSGIRAQRTALIAQHADFTDRKLEKSGYALTLLEDRMTALASRIEAIATPVEAQHDALTAATTKLEAMSARLTDVSVQTEKATAALGAATPAAIAQAERLSSLLATGMADLRSQLAETQTLLETLHSGTAAADEASRAAAEAVSARVEALVAASNNAQAAIAAPLAQLVEGVDTAFARTARAMDTTRDGVHAQTNAMLASVEQARVTLDHIGGEAARQVDTRLATLLSTAATLGSEIETQAARAQALIDDVSKGFTILDAKLGNSAATGTSTLDTITERMNEARDAIFRLGEPISATETALGTVEARLSSLGDAAATTFGSLDVALPAALPRLEDMAIRLSELHDRADQLSLPLQSGGDSITAAQAQLDRARASLETAAVQLGQELVTARDALTEIDTMTGSTSLAASSQLIDVFARVREIANQTAGTMRETLSNVVAEAEAALDQAGSQRAELAFGAPIRASIAEVEVLQERVAAAGQAAAERVTQRLLGLTETVAKVESRIDEVDTRYEIRARNTLSKRASDLVSSMQSGAIDIAGLLAFEIEDTAWDNYLAGDKSIFARRIVERIDAGGTRALARHFDHDAEFRTQATHYIEEFEALIAHVLPDREGHALATTLLSSHIGKLYIALGQSIGRFG
jgi:predicted  nucleic acid-binding Zn-ribbon protein